MTRRCRAGGLDAEAIARLRGWKGRGETLHDQLTAAPLRGLAATLDLDLGADALQPGAELPPLWHWLYFLPRAPHGEFGEDGAARGARQAFRQLRLPGPRPLFDTHSFRVCGRPSAEGRGAQFRAQDHDGALAMQADITFRQHIMKHTIPTPDQYQDMRDALRDLCGRYDSAYWQKVDAARGYPDEFVDALTKAGWLAAMIPAEYGGSGLGLAEASVVMEEVNFSGGNSGAVHGQMYNMSTVLRHGSAAQKQRYLPAIASGALRLQTMAVTEPTTGTDTTQLRTTAVRQGDRYVVNGQKVWISRIQHSDLMILLARTTPLAEVKKKSEGMSIFIVDLHQAIGHGMTVRPIMNMVNHETNEVFFDNLEIPAENLIGEEGKGFRYILDGLNAERTLIAAECLGDAYWFVNKARRYASERIVFNRPIGQNQGVAFPIADAYIETEAANLMRFKTCALFDAGQPCGAEANMSKYLAAKASWEAANVCLQTHGGFGFAHEYDVERKFRETRLYQVAPISTNLIYSYVAEHLLGLPRSF